MHELLKEIIRDGAAGLDGTVGFIDRVGILRLMIMQNAHGDILIERSDGDPTRGEETVRTLYMLRPDDKLIPIPLIEEGCLERARSA